MKDGGKNWQLLTSSSMKTSFLELVGHMNIYMHLKLPLDKLYSNVNGWLDLLVTSGNSFLHFYSLFLNNFPMQQTS